MIQTANIMGMPVKINIVDIHAEIPDIVTVFDYFRHIDDTFSTYRGTSEISRLNSGSLSKENVSAEVQLVLELCEETKRETNGYFDMEKKGKINPSGIVKGYAIHQGAEILKKKGYKNFSVEIAGDVEVAGKNENKNAWHIGIQNPFDTAEIVKVMILTDKGVATSGNYLQNHIYNPFTGELADEIASITVIGPNAYEADRFATAVFAMGENGIVFIENLKGFEAYMITKEKKAIMTSGFETFVV